MISYNISIYLIFILAELGKSSIVCIYLIRAIMNKLKIVINRQ